MVVGFQLGGALLELVEQRACQAAYDIRTLRGHNLLTKIGRSHRYQVLPPTARTVVAILTLREQVFAPIMAGFRVPAAADHQPPGTAIDRDFEALRLNMHTLFDDLAISTMAA